MTEHNTFNRSNEETVFIKKEAFRNMITHVLRFGSEVLENSVEVMGVCLGKIDSMDGKVIIDNAIPVMHGPVVSIGFSKKDIELFQQIENQYKKTIVGWYTSRPGWGLDFTEIIIANHQYFQNEKFPQGFCLIFDHTLMGLDGNFGFEIYRLDDYIKTDKYSTVSYEIEIPSTLEYFKWIQKFMEDFQKKNPILIKEINEIIEKTPENLQEIPASEISEEIEGVSEKYPEITSILSGFKRGSERFSDSFMNTFQKQIGNWINEIEQGGLRGTEYIVKAVEKMKQALIAGLFKMSGWFKKTLNESMNETKNSIYKYIDKRIASNKQLTEGILESKQNLVNNLNRLIEKKVKNIELEIEGLNNTRTQRLEETTQLNSEMEEKINKLGKNLSTIYNQVTLFTQEIDNKVATSLEPLKTNTDEKIKKMSEELEPFKKNYSEIRILLEKLQKVITEFRNLT